jgi:hypothetical protein
MSREMELPVELNLPSPLPDIPREWFIRPNGHQAADTIHGVKHAMRVWIHAYELAEALGLAPWEREALHCAALWHDIGRTHDGPDYYHGGKSAGRVVGLGLHEPLGEFERETALFVVTHHSGSEEHAKRGVEWMPDPGSAWQVFRMLKDADALDRVRLGPFNLNPSLLRLPESHERITRAWELLEASEDWDV